MKHAGAPYSGTPALRLSFIAVAEQIREAAGDIVHFSLFIRIVGMAVLIAISLLYWRLVEKRKLSEIGAARSIGGWFIGAGLGILLLIVSVCAVMVTGTIKLSGFSTNLSITMLLLMLGGYTTQGAAEELLAEGLYSAHLKTRSPCLWL